MITMVMLMMLMVGIFLEKANNEQLEFVRLLASNNTSHPRYNEAQETYNKERKKYTELKQQYRFNIRANQHFRKSRSKLPKKGLFY